MFLIVPIRKLDDLCVNILQYINERTNAKKFACKFYGEIPLKYIIIESISSIKRFGRK